MKVIKWSNVVRRRVSYREALQEGQVIPDMELRPERRKDLSHAKIDPMLCIPQNPDLCAILALLHIQIHSDLTEKSLTSA